METLAVFCLLLVNRQNKVVVLEKLAPVQSRFQRSTITNESLLQTVKQQLVLIMSVTHYVTPHLPPIFHSTFPPMSLSLSVCVLLLF